MDIYFWGEAKKWIQVFKTLRPPFSPKNQALGNRSEVYEIDCSKSYPFSLISFSLTLIGFQCYVCSSKIEMSKSQSTHIHTTKKIRTKDDEI